MRTLCFFALAAAFSLSIVLAGAEVADAHFGMIIPDAAIVQPPKRKVKLELAFAHPFEGHGMDLERPAKLTAYTDGESVDLSGKLKAETIMGSKGWQASYKFKRPGVTWFAMEPKPYFEPAEDCYIIHYTKTAVAAFGAEDGWEAPVGLPVEIVPLVRPFGNYAGNIVRGRVLKNGKPLADCVVEVEHYAAGKLASPTDYHVTQVVLTDADGEFAFACPWAGWWGFAALTEADGSMDYKGTAKPVELGGVLWLYMDAAPAKNGD